MKKHCNIHSIPEYAGIGVYKIVNPINGRVYIGSALDCKARLNQHNRNLPNDEMQKDCPVNGFLCEIIQKFENGCTNRELAAAEVKHYEEYLKKPAGVYNRSDIRPQHNARRGDIDDYIFGVRVPKGKRQEIQEHAEKMGESTNAFIQRAIDEAIARDTAK